MSDILREIGLIYRTLSAISNVEFKDWGLHKGQYLYVTRIFENPGIINDNLADLVKQERTVVAKSVKKLEEDGFIRKERDSENQKIRCLYVTEKGQEAYQFLRREEHYSESQILEGFSPIEKVALLDYLKRLNENLADDWHSLKKGQKRQY